MSESLLSQPSVRPPDVGDRDSFLERARSPWYALVADLQDVVLRTTADYSRARGVRNLHLPVTTRTITCPSGLGSDTYPCP